MWYDIVICQHVNVKILINAHFYTIWWGRLILKWMCILQSSWSERSEWNVVNKCVRAVVRNCALRSLTVCGMKLLHSVEVPEQMLLYHLLDGKRATRLRGEFGPSRAWLVSCREGRDEPMTSSAAQTIHYRVLCSLRQCSFHTIPGCTFSSAPVKCTEYGRRESYFPKILKPLSCIYT